MIISLTFYGEKYTRGCTILGDCPESQQREIAFMRKRANELNKGYTVKPWKVLIEHENPAA